GAVGDVGEGLGAVDVDVHGRGVGAVVEGADLGGPAAGRGRGGREGQDEGGGQDGADQDAESCHYMTSCNNGLGMTRTSGRPREGLQGVARTPRLPRSCGRMAWSLGSSFRTPVWMPSSVKGAGHTRPPDPVSTVGRRFLAALLF